MILTSTYMRATVIVQFILNQRILSVEKDRVASRKLSDGNRIHWISLIVFYPLNPRITRTRESVARTARDVSPSNRKVLSGMSQASEVGSLVKFYKQRKMCTIIKKPLGDRQGETNLPTLHTLPVKAYHPAPCKSLLHNTSITELRTFTNTSLSPDIILPSILSSTHQGGVPCTLGRKSQI